MLINIGRGEWGRKLFLAVLLYLFTRSSVPCVDFQKMGLLMQQCNWNRSIFFGVIGTGSVYVMPLWLQPVEGGGCKLSDIALNMIEIQVLGL